MAQDLQTGNQPISKYAHADNEPQNGTKDKPIFNNV
jgi:hypothetical protein